MFMKRKIGIITVTALLLLVLVAGQGLARPAYVAGKLTNYISYNLDEDSNSDLSLALDFEIEKDIGPGELYLNPLITYNFEVDEGDIELKEGYYDLYFNKFDLRLGKQRVTWGKADGLIVTNLINPPDLKHYPVVEYGDQFQNINAARANIYLGADNLEVIWIPEFKAAVFDQGIFSDSIKDKLNLPGNIKINPAEKLESKLENSEVAVRYSSLGSKYDYELAAAYLWDDRPTMHINPATMKVSQHYHRLPLVGGSISTARGPFVFRGETAYMIGKYFNIRKFTEYPDGTVQRDILKWLFGIDYTRGDYLYSLQFLQEAVLDYEENIIQDEFSNTATLLIKRDFLRSTLSTELNFYYALAQEELWAKPRISYDYSDRVNIKAGLDYALEGGRMRDNALFLQTEFLF